MDSLNQKTLKNEHHDFFVDPLRIAAFSSVLVAHIYASQIEIGVKNLSAEFSIIYSLLRPFWSSGGFGVTLFFIISGYVITKAAQRENSTNFALRRIFRIYPSLIVALLIYWWLIPSGVFTPLRLLGSVSLFGDFWGSPNELGGVDWTLRLEIIFYVLVFIVLKTLENLSTTRVIKRLPSSNYSLLLVILLFFCASMFVIPNFPYTGGARAYFNIFFPAFIAGIALAFLQTHRISKLSASFIYVIAFLTSQINLTFFRPELLESGPFMPYAYFVFAIMFVFKSSISKKKSIAYVASLTYVIYLFHAWLMPAIQDIFTRFTHKLFPQVFDETIGIWETILNTGATLVIFVIFIVLFSKYIEKPIINWSRTLGIISNSKTASP